MHPTIAIEVASFAATSGACYEGLAKNRV